MFWLKNIYTFFNSIFEILTFRTNPEINDDNNNYQKISKKKKNNAWDEYEFVMLNEM
jgi:hypothetical protein